MCFWLIYTLYLSPNPCVVSVGKEPILTTYHFSPMHYNVIIWTKIMWSRELPLNWSMVRIGLRPAKFLRRKIVLSHSLMNFQFCDQLYGIWFQMSCDFSIFKPWQGDIIKHKKDLNDIYNHKSLGFSLFHVLQLLANTFLNSFLCKKFLKKFFTCWCFCQIALSIIQ